MALQYRKRVNLGKGIGLNVSRSGISPSVRTRLGSVSTKGFSLRTGIPGLSYRASFGKSKGLPLLLLLAGAAYLLAIVLYNIATILIHLVTTTGRWIAVRYRQYKQRRQTGIQPQQQKGNNP